ncbi:type VI secretion IcmF C-terminal domain-containing protein [Pseudoroseomonas wenyumeiae]
MTSTAFTARSATCKAAPATRRGRARRRPPPCRRSSAAPPACRHPSTSGSWASAAPAPTFRPTTPGNNWANCGAAAPARPASAWPRTLPFAPAATSEIPLGDFGRLFGRDGLIDGFFTANLKGLVETGRSPWTPRAGGRAAPVPPSPGAVRARRRHPRQPVPGRWQPALLGFSLALVQADPAVQAVMVELDGRRLEFRPGDAEARRIRWPGAEGTGAAAVTFVGPEGPVTAASERGGWALFRLLDDATLRPRGRDALELQIAAGGRQAVFILTADGATNPFARSLLASFRCPQSL